MRSITKVTKKSGVLFLSRLPKGWTSFPSPAHTYSGSNFARCTRRSASVRRPAEVVKVVRSPKLCLKKWMEPLHCITWSFSLLKGSLWRIAITKLHPLSTVDPGHETNQDPRNSSQDISTRWFKVTFWSPSWRSLNPLNGSLNHPKKVTLNHRAVNNIQPRFAERSRPYGQCQRRS